MRDSIRRRQRWVLSSLLLGLLCAATAAKLPGQKKGPAKTEKVTLRSCAGKTYTGVLRAFGPLGVSLSTSAGELRLTLPELLDFRVGRGVPTEHAMVVLELRGGGRLAGAVLGGDEDGEKLDLRSRSVGTIEVPIDSVLALRCRVGGKLPEPRLLRPAKEDAADEVLYRRTGERFDPIPGFLDSIRGEGLKFQWRSRKQPALFAWKDVGGLWLGENEEGEGAKQGKEAQVVLLLRDSSLLRGRVSGLKDGKLLLEAQGLPKIELPLSAILAGHVEHAASRSFLSSLDATACVERSFFGDGEPVLYPYRKDRPVTGEVLAVAEEAFTRGLGVHSYSKLEYIVPEGCQRFWTGCGIDDTAMSLNFPGNVDFQVLLDGKSVRDARSVRGGKPAQFFDPIPVRAGQKLTLIVSFGKDQHRGDRADWLMPVFLRG